MHTVRVVVLQAWDLDAIARLCVEVFGKRKDLQIWFGQRSDAYKLRAKLAQRLRIMAGPDPPVRTLAMTEELTLQGALWLVPLSARIG